MKNSGLSLLLATMLTSFLGSSCNYDPGFGDIACDQEGAVEDGRTCKDGYWVETADQLDAGDVAVDVIDVPDMAPDLCVPEDDPPMCARLGLNCDDVTAQDNCGAERTLNCGVCEDPQTCGGGGTANVCGCTPETRQQFCSRNTATCDSLTGLDNCGIERTENCGTCIAPATCGGTWRSRRRSAASVPGWTAPE